MAMKTKDEKVKAFWVLVHIPYAEVKYNAQLSCKPISLLSKNSGSMLLYVVEH